MLSVAEAQAAINAAIPALPDATVTLQDACQRVLRQDVLAERDQPPFDRVTMDGIALRHAALANGRQRFRIKGTQFAGDPPQRLEQDSDCIEVMTGTPLPDGADCIVPVERLQVADGHAVIEDGYLATARQFVHARGSDHTAGHRLLARGRRISPIDVALLASAGLAQLQVAKSPVIRVISTGNELVAAGKPIEPQQIRSSNGPALVAMLQAQGYSDSRYEHLADDPDAMFEAIGQRLAESDVLVLSGGVSMGKADFVPQVLEKLGVQQVFHRIAQRPGKPMWFGMAAAGQAVFALPGNPVSALTCCRHYVLPALMAASGSEVRRPDPVVLSDAFQFKPDLTCFLPVRISSDDSGQRHASPAPTNTSGDFTALANTDGYVELARDQQDFAAGSIQPFHAWQSI